MEDDSVSGSESYDDFQSHKNSPRRNKENNFKGHGGPNFTRETQFESNGMKSGRRNSFNDDFDRATRGSRGNNRGFQGNDFDGMRMSNRGSDMRSFNGPKREGFGNDCGRNSFNDDFDRSAQGSRSNNKGFRGNDFDGQRMSNGGDNVHKFKGPRRESRSVEGLMNMGGTRTGALKNLETADALLKDRSMFHDRNGSGWYALLMLHSWFMRQTVAAHTDGMECQRSKLESCQFPVYWQHILDQMHHSFTGFNFSMHQKEVSSNRKFSSVAMQGPCGCNL